MLQCDLMLWKLVNVNENNGLVRKQKISLEPILKTDVIDIVNWKFINFKTLRDRILISIVIEIFLFESILISIEIVLRDEYEMRFLFKQFIIFTLLIPLASRYTCQQVLAKLPKSNKSFQYK